MSCTNNLCLDQLLEPDAQDELIVLNNNGSAAAFETGITSIPLGAQSVDVIFTTEKLSSVYTFNEISVVNTTDNSPLMIQPTITGYSIIGFNVSLSGITDSANYKLRWEVEVTEV